MTRIHQILGVTCTYPENWQLTEDRENDRLVSFTIQSPKTAFMSVFVSPTPGQASQLVTEMTELLCSEYDEVEVSELDEASLDVPGLPEDVEAAELNFYYLDVIVTARLIAFSEENRTVLVQCQAEDREFDSLQMVFKAMLVSMLMAAKEKTSPDLG